MRRLGPLLGVLLLLGCSSQAPPAERSFVAFQVVGDGHQSRPARMALEGGQVVLRGEAEASVDLSAATTATSLEAVTGQGLLVKSGSLRLPNGQTLQVLRGTLTLQNLQGGLARGNFEVLCQPTGTATPAGDKPLRGELDIRGSFDAEAR
ncbi:MAG: hypothetical protein PSX37_10985 [bacterium]|nr:hypothetical protein [bacterium]